MNAELLDFQGIPSKEGLKWQIDEYSTYMGAGKYPRNFQKEVFE